MPEAEIDTTAEEVHEPEAVVAAEEDPTEPEGKGSKAAVLANLAKERDARQAAEAARKQAEAARKDADKKLADLAAKVKAYEDRDKSESEKQQEAIEAAKTAAAEAASARDKAEKELLRYRIGMKTEGFPASLIPRLQGDTEEEIAEDAKRLLEDLGASNKPIRKAPTASPGLKSGASAPGEHPADGKERAAQALREFRRGGR